MSVITVQNENYLYFIDNGFLFYSRKENKYWTQCLSNKILENGKIIHRPKFLREFQIFLKKRKIIKKFSQNVLCVIVPPNFNEIDKEILKKIFDDLPFQKLRIIKEWNVYNLKKNTLWINLNLDYAYLTYLKKQKKETIILKNNYLSLNFEEQIVLFLKNNANIKKVFFCGTNPEISMLSQRIEKRTKKIILYFEDASKYILKESIRHNFP